MLRRIGFLIAIIVVCLLLNISYIHSVYSENQVAININGSLLKGDIVPFMSDGTVFVPLRGVFEKLGGQVNWDPNQNMTIIYYDNYVVVVRPDSQIIVINGVEKFGYTKTFIDKGRIMIPLRFICENIGLTVNWVPQARLATVTEPSYYVKASQKVVLGYTVNDYKGDNESYESLLKYSGVNSIATFSYTFDKYGNLHSSGESQKNSVQYANEHNIKPLAVIHNYSNNMFSQSLAHSAIIYGDVRAKLIDNIFELLVKEQYSGVNIDIENLYWGDRQSYTAFIKELKEKLAPYGYLTTIAVPAKTYDSLSDDNWGGAFDYKELGKYADEIVLMTYDEHYFGGNSGSIASMPWVSNVLKFAVGNVPSYKLILGIPAYGYDWSSSGNKIVKFKDAASLIAKQGLQKSGWDDLLCSPYFVYYRSGTLHTVWYENKDSIATKIGLADEYKLGGIGIWRLGYDNIEFWNSLKHE